MAEKMCPVASSVQRSIRPAAQFFIHRLVAVHPEGFQDSDAPFHSTLLPASGSRSPWPDLLSSGSGGWMLAVCRASRLVGLGRPLAIGFEDQAHEGLADALVGP